MTAPLFGNVSHPPEAMDATLCRISGDIPMELAQASQSLDRRSSANDMPPDAEPVISAKVVTDTASETRGVPPIFIPSKAAAIDLKPGSAAMTLPYPTSEAVFMMAKRDPIAPTFKACWNPPFFDMFL